MDAETLVADLLADEDAVARQVMVAQHLRAMLPAEQLRVLMLAAASVIVGGVPAEHRGAALAYASATLVVSVGGAEAAAAQALAAMPAAGCA